MRSRRAILRFGIALPAVGLLAACGTGAGAVALAATSAAACVLSPEETEGPYYVDGAVTRSDITEGKPGLPLQLKFTVLNAASCAPLSGATLDIWHCDASGVYSGYTAATAGPGGPGGPPPGGPPPGGGG
ncbi:MAG TPA: dioxygenase, partial [Chloroflexota bacterium]